MPPTLGIIEVIHATSIEESTSWRKGILKITPREEAYRHHILYLLRLEPLLSNDVEKCWNEKYNFLMSK